MRTAVVIVVEESLCFLPSLLYVEELFGAIKLLVVRTVASLYSSVVLLSADRDQLVDYPDRLEIGIQRVLHVDMRVQFVGKLDSVVSLDNVNLERIVL